jgi:hypothetical protein
VTIPKVPTDRSPRLFVLHLHTRLATAPVAGPASEVRRQISTVTTASVTSRQAGPLIVELAVVLFAVALVLVTRSYQADGPVLAALTGYVAALGMHQRVADQLRRLVTRTTIAGPSGGRRAYWRYLPTRAAIASSNREPSPTT